MDMHNSVSCVAEYTRHLCLTVVASSRASALSLCERWALGQGITAEGISIKRVGIHKMGITYSADVFMVEPCIKTRQLHLPMI